MASPTWLMTSGGVMIAATTNTPTIAYLRLRASRSARDQADPAHQRQRDRQLEAEAEREDQLHHQRQILADPGLELDRQRRPAPPGVSKLRKNRQASGKTK